VFSGANGALLRTLTTPSAPQPAGQFGHAVAIGNLNGDAKRDIIVGADGETVTGNVGQGRVYGFSGLMDRCCAISRRRIPPPPPSLATRSPRGTSAEMARPNIAAGSLGETVGVNARRARIHL